MRVRHIAALTVAVLVAGVVTFQAVTAVPPQPYVRLVHDRPIGPWSREECRGGVVYGIYTTNDGRELPAVTDGTRCIDGRPPSVAVRYHRE